MKKKIIIPHCLSEPFPKSNIKIVEIGKIDTPSTQIHGRSLSLLGIGTSIKSGGVRLVCPSFE